MIGQKLTRNEEIFLSNLHEIVCSFGEVNVGEVNQAAIKALKEGKKVLDLTDIPSLNNKFDIIHENLTGLDLYGIDKESEEDVKKIFYQRLAAKIDNLASEKKIRKNLAFTKHKNIVPSVDSLEKVVIAKIHGYRHSSSFYESVPPSSDMIADSEENKYFEGELQLGSDTLMSVIIEDVQGVDNCFSIESGILDSDTLKELTFREFLFLESIENRVLIEKAILNKKVSNLADVKQLIQSAAIIKQYPVIYLLIKKNALSFDQAVKLNILEKSILASNSDIIDDKMFDYVFVLKHHLLLAEINGSIKLQRIISSDKIYVQLVKHCCEHDIDALSCFINYAEQFLYGYNIDENSFEMVCESLKTYRAFVGLDQKEVVVGQYLADIYDTDTERRIENIKDLELRYKIVVLLRLNIITEEDRLFIKEPQLGFLYDDKFFDLLAYGKINFNRLKNLCYQDKKLISEEVIFQLLFHELITLDDLTESPHDYFALLTKLKPDFVISAYKAYHEKQFDLIQLFTTAIKCSTTFETYSSKEPDIPFYLLKLVKLGFKLENLEKYNLEQLTTIYLYRHPILDRKVTIDNLLEECANKNCLSHQSMANLVHENIYSIYNLTKYDEFILKIVNKWNLDLLFASGHIKFIDTLDFSLAHNYIANKLIIQSNSLSINQIYYNTPLYMYAYSYLHSLGLQQQVDKHSPEYIENYFMAIAYYHDKGGYLNLVKKINARLYKIVQMPSIQKLIFYKYIDLKDLVDLAPKIVTLLDQKYFQEALYQKIVTFKQVKELTLEELVFFEMLLNSHLIQTGCIKIGEISTTFSEPNCLSLLNPVISKLILLEKITVEEALSINSLPSTSYAEKIASLISDGYYTLEEFCNLTQKECDKIDWQTFYTRKINNLPVQLQAE